MVREILVNASGNIFKIAVSKALSFPVSMRIDITPQNAPSAIFVLFEFSRVFFCILATRDFAPYEKNRIGSIDPIEKIAKRIIDDFVSGLFMIIPIIIARVGPLHGAHIGPRNRPFINSIKTELLFENLPLVIFCILLLIGDRALDRASIKPGNINSRDANRRKIPDRILSLSGVSPSSCPEVAIMKVEIEKLSATPRARRTGPHFDF